MATITTLGFSIRSSYDPSGTRAATRSLITVGAVAQATTTRLNGTSAGMQNMAAAALALAPALIPIGTVATGVGAATVAMAVSSGSALGIYGAAMGGAIKRTLEMAEANKKLDPMQKVFIGNVDRMKGSWDKFIKSTQNQTLMVANDVVSGLAVAVGRLKPVVDAVHPSIKRVSQALQDWLQGEGLQRFIDTIIKHGVPAMNSLLKAGRDVLAVLGIGFRTFAPEGVKVAQALERGAAALRQWAEGGGFTRFLENVNKNAPQVRQFFQALGAALRNISTAMAGLGPLSLGLATTLLRLVAALPPSWIQALVVGFVAFRTVMVSLMIIRTIVTVFMALRTAILAVRGAWMILSLAFSSTPIGAILTAVVALVAGIVYLATQTRFFQTVWNAVWNGIKVAWNATWNALRTAWQAFMAYFGPIWNTWWTSIKAVGQAIWTGIQVAWQTFWGVFTAIGRAAWTVIQAAWTAFWSVVRTVAEGVWNVLKAAWNAFFAVLKAVWEVFKAFFTGNWSAAWNAIKAAGQAIWNLIKTAWQAFINGVKAIWNAFSSFFKTAWNAFWNAVKTVANTIWNGIKALWNAFITAVKTIYNAFATFFKNAWNTFWTTVKNVANGIWNAIKSLWSGFTNGVKDIAGKFADWMKDRLKKAWESIRDTAKKLWHEIGEIIEKAINAVTGIINKLIQGFNKITSFLKIDVKISEIPKVNFNFATGGMVPGEAFARGGMAGAKDLRRGGAVMGYSPGRDTVPAMLSPGEGVLTPEAVRGLGGPGFVHAANRTWAGHRGAGKGHNSLKHAGRYNHFMNHYATGGMVPVQHFAVGGITAAALARAGVSLGMVTQGEYSNGSLSAGTHLGGGVVDIAAGPGDYALVSALRAAGFAAWLRTPAEGFAYHIHAVLMNHPDLSPAARAQVASYLAGGNGLANGGPDTGGGIDFFGIIKDNVGKILHNVYRGLEALAGIGGGIAEFFGMGGGDDGKEKKGLFGTGIGPDFGPDIPGADKVGDVVKGVAGAATGMSGLGGMLGQMVLSFLDLGNIKEGFQDSYDDVKGFGGIAGGFGEIAIGMGKKILEKVIPDFLMKKKEENPFNMADFAGAFGSGGTQQWAGLAAAALAMVGLSASQLPRFLALMAAESGGNPLAVNNYDINAKNGTPSKGLMQVIQPTFDAYHVPGTSNNIFDPLANMAAAANYIKHVYGGQVPGSPYRLGTNNASRGWHLVGENGPEMRWFSGGEHVADARETARRLHARGEHSHGTCVHFEDGAIQIDARGSTADAVREMESNLVPKLRQAVMAGVGNKKG
jgi:SLT domain-containing protein/phage-related protein